MEEHTRRVSPNIPPMKPPKAPKMRSASSETEIYTDGRVEDTALEEELLAHGDYPSSIREVTPIEKEDELDLIDYLMSNNGEDM